MQPGVEWTGEYWAVAVEDCSGAEAKKPKIHRIREVVVPDARTFPMKIAKDQALAEALKTKVVCGITDVALLRGEVDAEEYDSMPFDAPLVNAVLSALGGKVAKDEFCPPPFPAPESMGGAYHGATRPPDVHVLVWRALGPSAKRREIE